MSQIAPSVESRRAIPRAIMLICDFERARFNPHVIQRLKSLEGVHRFVSYVRPTDIINRTIDATNSPGVFELLHWDTGRLDELEAQIRDLERSDLYLSLNF